MALVNAANVNSDALVGERYGRDLAADASNINTDTLVGERYGRNIKADVIHANVDTLVGDRYGRNVAADVAHVFVEVLIWSYPVSASNVISEALVSLPDDPIRQGAQVYRTAEEVAQQRDPLPHPATVWSPLYANTYGQVVTTYRDTPVEWQRSPLTAGTLRSQAMQARTPGVPHSPLAAKTLRRMVVMSRGYMYVPESGVFASSTRALVSTVRNTQQPGALRSRIAVARTFALAVVSKVARGPEPTNIQVATSTALATVKRMQRAPVNQHVAVVAQLVITPHLPVVYIGATPVTQLHALAVQPRAVPVQHSATTVSEFAQLVAHARTDAAPHGVESVAGLAMFSVARRLTAPPAAMGGWSMGAVCSTALTIRNVLLPTQLTHVQAATARITYTMGRTVKAPIDVIDPGIGRHSKTLHQLSVRFRSTDSPEDRLRQQRNVFGLSQTPVVADGSFAPPPTEAESSSVEVALVAQHVVATDVDWEWEPTSRVTLAGLQQAVVVDDTQGWQDPNGAGSDAVVHASGQLVVAADPDAWPDPQAAASDADVTCVLSAVAMADDSFPDGLAVRSEVAVTHVVQHVAMVDDSFPEATPWVSAFDMLSVARAVVARDNSLVGRLPASQTHTLAVGEVVVVADPSLNGIPKRPRGPRPSVSIAMG